MNGSKIKLMQSPDLIAISKEICPTIMPSRSYAPDNVLFDNAMEAAELLSDFSTAQQ
jgi:hypothetical protein